MSALVVAVITFVSLAAGAFAGMYAARRLEERHLAKETQDSVKLGVGMVAAMASLVLGLMTASVKGNFDATNKDVQQYATYVIMLDSTLRRFGPEASDAREKLHDFALYTYRLVWPEHGARQPGELDGREVSIRLGAIDTAIHTLTPANSEQTDLRAEALSRFRMLDALRWTIVEESVTAVPHVFIVVLIVWLTLIFVSFGLFSPINRITVTALLLCALSLAGAIFLILEMSEPFDGIIAVSPRPLINALHQIRQ